MIKRFCHGCSREGVVRLSSTEYYANTYPINPISIFVEFIIAQLIVDTKSDDEGSCEPDG